MKTVEIGKAEILSSCQLVFIEEKEKGHTWYSCHNCIGNWDGGLEELRKWGLSFRTSFTTPYEYEVFMMRLQSNIAAIWEEQGRIPYYDALSQIEEEYIEMWKELFGDLPFGQLIFWDSQADRYISIDDVSIKAVGIKQ